MVVWLGRFCSNICGKRSQGPVVLSRRRGVAIRLRIASSSYQVKQIRQLVHEKKLPANPVAHSRTQAAAVNQIMHQDQNSARLGGSQRQLLMQVLGSKLQQTENDAVRHLGGMRTQSPADDIQGAQGYPDVDAMGSAMFGNAGSANHQLRRAAEEAFAAQIEDRKHLPDRAHWGMIGANSGMGAAGLAPSSMVSSWGRTAGNPLEGAPAATGLLNQQAHYDEHLQDTEVDAPMANLHLHNLQTLAQKEALVGSWPTAGKQSAADAALPFFSGRPIRTTGSNLASMPGVQRNSSFSGAHPGSARATMGMENSFAAEQLCYNACNSAPITPRSPSFNGYAEKESAMAFPGMPGLPMSRHGPSKLRMSSSDNPAVSQPGMHLPGAMAGLDAFSNPFPGQADQGPMAAGLHAALQQQHMVQQAGLGLGPGSLPGSQPGSSNGAAAAAALMAGMGGDPSLTGMMHGMMDAANGMDAAAAAGMNQMQMLMYFAQLGMMASLNGSPMSMPGTPTAAMTNSPMAAAAAAGGMGNPMMFNMMNPAQLAAFNAAQQQWQSNMPASAIANIAAAAAVAATAASNPEADTGYGSNRSSSRPRGPPPDRLDRRLRCDKGLRSSNGRMDDCGSPCAGRIDPLLEEFKNNRTRKWEMRDILGHMLEFSLDQLGSRFIQQKLDSLTPEELEAAFAEIAPKGIMLMNDVFGNYVIQKFLELEVDVHRQELAQQMKGQVLQLSLQLYSCRVIQKALEVLPLDQKIAMVHELDGHLMRCVRDQNGNHVIQKVIECVPTQHITGLLDTFSGNLVSLSHHPFGCRVMQRILEHCSDQSRYDNFMGEILKATVQLAQDQYGNYVIQHVVERGRPHERNQVYDRLFPHIVVLSQNKFASNVVEKMLLHCEPEQRASIVEEFLRQPAGSTLMPDVSDGANPRDQSPLEQMMQDQYGNYVVQKTLEVCDESQRERMLSRVRCYYEILKTSTFGKHIVNRLEKLLSAGMRIQVNSLPPMLPTSNPPAPVPAAAPVAAPVAAPAQAAEPQQPAAADAAATTEPATPEAVASAAAAQQA